MTRKRRKHRQQSRLRRAAASLDYVLVMGIVLPLAALLFRVAPRMMNLVYEMTCVLISWPFM
jgi:hypothetical protein